MTVVALGTASIAGAQFLHLSIFGNEPAYKQGKHAHPGYLGVGLRDIDKEAAAQLHLSERNGAEIVSVDRDAPAGQVGLRTRDVLLAINGTRIDSSDHLRKLLRNLPPGRQVSLLLMREGEPTTVSVQLADEAQVAAQAWHPADLSATSVGALEDNGAPRSGSSGTGSRPGALSMFGAFSVSPLYTGAELDALSTQLAEFFGVHDGMGLLVRFVNTDSPASAAGLRAGDVIMRVNSQPVVSRTDWMRQLHENRGRPMLLTVMRNKQQQTMTLTTGDVKKKS